VREHEGVLVVRDDLFPGGTKARFMHYVFDDADEAVYASPAEGGAQTALATVARQLGKRATIFVAHRIRPHPRTLEAARLGAKVVAVKPGYLSVVQARAREYCEQTGAAIVPFGVEAEFAIEAIAQAAGSLAIEPDAKSGVQPAREFSREALPVPGRRRGGTRSGSDAPCPRPMLPEPRSTNTRFLSGERHEADRRSRPIRTTTRRLGSYARPGRARAACCSGT
jgi:hypothetical protein